MLEGFDKLKASQQDYFEAKNSTMRKKEKLYEEGNMAKWGLSSIPAKKPEKAEAMKIIMPKDNEDLAKFRIRYGVRNFHLYEELNRHFLKNNIYMGSHMMNYTRTQSNIVSELMMMWVDAQTQAVGMLEGKSIEGAVMRA